jgi:hypothetical protein
MKICTYWPAQEMVEGIEQNLEMAPLQRLNYFVKLNWYGGSGWKALLIISY